MLSTVLAQAQPFGQGSLTQIESNIPGFKFAGANLATLINNSTGPIQLIFYGIGLFLLINIVSAGISLMTAGGDPGKVKAAHSKITNSLIGLLLALSAYWIVKIVAVLLGLPGIAGTFK
jgi:hypothetical protein